MAIDVEAMNLTDFALFDGPPKREKEFAFSMIKAGTLFQDIPIETDPALQMTGARFVGPLDGPTWSKLNTEPTHVKSLPKEYTEQMYLVRDKVEIDIRLVEAALKRGDNPVKLFKKQIDAYAKALSYDLNQKLLMNDHITGTSDAFVGVRGRLFEANNLYQVNAECKVDAGGTVMSPAGVTAATTSSLIAQIQTVLDAMDESEGDNIVIVGNDLIIRQLERGIRLMGAGGGFDMTKDAFGRSVRMYRNAKLRRAGRTAPNASQVQSQIITSTQTATGTVDTGGTMTSLYFINAAVGKFHAKQAHAMKPSDPKLLENGVTYRSVMENGYMLVQDDTRALGVLYNIVVG